jgi:hypothetical protein
MSGAKSTCRKSHAKKNMVNGLMSQFVTTVIVSPRGCLRTSRRLRKSIWSIMGKIMAQISTATGRFTCATVKRESVSGTAGIHCPSATPVTMQRATHTVR